MKGGDWRRWPGDALLPSLYKQLCYRAYPEVLRVLREARQRRAETRGQVLGQQGARRVDERPGGRIAGLAAAMKRNLQVGASTSHVCICLNLCHLSHLVMQYHIVLLNTH